MRDVTSTHLEQLRMAFLSQASAQLDLLEEELDRNAGPSDEALRLSHNLRGTAGCYEFKGLHIAGVELDEALRSDAEASTVQLCLASARAAIRGHRAASYATLDDDAWLEGKRVVAVEDDPSTGLLISRAVERLGCVVEWFDDGLGALERLQRGPDPDLLLPDLMLPSISGQELANALAHSKAGNTPPIVVVSARPQEEVQNLTDALSLMGSISKPFSIDNLTRVVRCALETLRV